MIHDCLEDISCPHCSSFLDFICEDIDELSDSLEEDGSEYTFQCAHCGEYLTVSLEISYIYWVDKAENLKTENPQKDYPGQIFFVY